VLDDLRKHVPSLVTECINSLNVYRDELQKIRKEGQELGIGGSPSLHDSSQTALDPARTYRAIHQRSELARQDAPKAD
jgi:hypothetical protein